MLKKEQFLVSVTTTGEWKEKIKEINILSLERIALFTTFIELKERKELYSLLEKTNLKEVPFCHIRSDVELWELDYLKEKWNCKAFNLHTEREYPMKYDYSDYKDMIYIENIYFPLLKKEIKSFAGICLDLSHLESDRILYKEKYENNIKIIEKYKIGCNHISAITEPYQDEKDHTVVSKHYMDDIKEMDYLKNYPDKYFSRYCAVELENSLEEQLKVIDYIVNQSKSNN